MQGMSSSTAEQARETLLERHKHELLFAERQLLRRNQFEEVMDLVERRAKRMLYLFVGLGLFELVMLAVNLVLADGAAFPWWQTTRTFAVVLFVSAGVSGHVRARDTRARIEGLLQSEES